MKYDAFVSQRPFFVMMYLPTGEGAGPLTSDEHDVLFFASEEEAREYAEHHPFAPNLGYEIFDMRKGE